MKKISIFIFLISFLLYRPYVMQSNGMMYEGDDPTYFSYASSIAFFQFPSFEKELVNNPRHFIGSGILAAPFVFIFSTIDRILGASIIQSRTMENVSKSWTLFGFVFSSIFYFWLSCYLLYRAAKLFFDERQATLAIVLMILIQGVPLFVYRRPIFSHIYEFFLQSLFVHIAIKKNFDNGISDEKFIFPVVVGFLMGMMCLIRFNNIVNAFIWPLAIWGIHENRIAIMRNRNQIIISYGILVLPVIFFFVIPELMGDGEWLMWVLARIAATLKNVTGTLIAIMNIKRYFYVFLGSDWGLLFTAPFIVFSALSLFGAKTSYRKVFLIPFLPVMVFNFFFLVVANNTHGSWYGYRYLIFSAIPVLILPMGNVIKYSEQSDYRKSWNIMIVIIMIFPLLSMLCFEGNPDSLTLRLSPLWGGWKNPTYQLEIWKILYSDFIGFCKAIFKGGPLYLIYIFAIIMNKSNLLPQIVLEKYPTFEYTTLIKSLVIYCSPFLLSSIAYKAESKGLIKKII